MDRFDDLQTFVLVAEKKSIRQTAEFLGRAPSAVSRRVKDLEARLHAQLFTRTTRQIQLTAAGERFLPQAQQILTALDEAERCVAADSQEVSGELRLTMPLSFGLAHLAPAINDFMLENPELNIDAALNDRALDLTSHRLDLAIRIGTPGDSTLKSRRLAPIHQVVAASPSYWEMHGVPSTPSQLKGQPALCYSNLTTPHLWPWSHASGESDRLIMTPRYRANNGDALVQAAISGLGVVRLPSFMLNTAITAGQLQPVLLSTNWGSAGLYALYPNTAYLPYRTRAFIDYLVTRFGEQPHWDACLREHLQQIDNAPVIGTM